MDRRVMRLGMIALLICAVAIGAGQVLAKKPKPGTPTCPTGAPGCFCPTYYAPVACEADNGLTCVYSNQCFAGCAGFSADDCTAIGPGPVVY